MCVCVACTLDSRLHRSPGQAPVSGCYHLLVDMPAAYTDCTAPAKPPCFRELSPVCSQGGGVSIQGGEVTFNTCNIYDNDGGSQVRHLTTAHAYQPVTVFHRGDGRSFRELSTCVGRAAAFGFTPDRSRCATPPPLLFGCSRFAAVAC